MAIQGTRKPAARKYSSLCKLVLATGALAVGTCSLPPESGVNLPTPTAAIRGPGSAPRAALQDELETILQKMEAAYDKVRDYQTEVETVFFEKDGSFEAQKSLYTFKKPKRIRLDFLSPQKGMTLLYPDPEGKVLMKPGGLLSILRFHLTLDDARLENPAGQPISETDLGALIRNIRHSVTDQRRGPVSISQDEDVIQIHVLADDHFRDGVEARYQFLISKELWLPVQVGVSTPDGLQEQRIVFRDLLTNVDVPDDFFQ